MNSVLSNGPKSVPRSICGNVVQLGGMEMPAAIQADDSESSVDRAIALLRDALRILDAIGDRPELGARLQEVIEALVEDRRSA